MRLQRGGVGDEIGAFGAMGDRAAVEELMDYAYLRNDHRLSNCKQFVLCISAKGLQYLTGLRAARSCLKRSDPGTFG